MITHNGCFVSPFYLELSHPALYFLECFHSFFSIPLLIELHEALLAHTASSLCPAGSSAVARRLSCPAACGILVPQSGIEPASPALQGKFLATGLPRQSSAPTALSLVTMSQDKISISRHLQVLYFLGVFLCFHSTVRPNAKKLFSVLNLNMDQSYVAFTSTLK